MTPSQRFSRLSTAEQLELLRDFATEHSREFDAYLADALPEPLATQPNDLSYDGAGRARFNWQGVVT